METKYAVIKLDVLDHCSEIIKVFCTHERALEFMNKCADSNIEFVNRTWFRKEREQTDEISIYQLHYIARKTLVCKYLIKVFEEDINEYN